MMLIQRSSTTELKTDDKKKKDKGQEDGVELEVVVDHSAEGLGGAVGPIIRPDTIDPGRIIRDVYVCLYLLAQVRSRTNKSFEF